MRFQRQDAQAPRRKGKTGSEAFLYWLLIGDRNLPCSRPFSVLSADFAAFGEGLFNAEDARGGAEFCRESFSSVTLGEALRDLGVESGCLPVWWRLAALCLGVKISPPGWLDPATRFREKLVGFKL